MGYLTEDESWQVIAAQRRALADLLETLTPTQWSTASLCSGWRVRDVAAHVALASQPLGWSLLRDAARARGSFHRLNRDVALRAFPAADELIAVLRRDADSRRLPFVTNYRNLVPDILVHGQDIALPLGLDHPVPVLAARAGAAHVWSMGWPFHARRRLAGLQLSATDADWRAGRGSTVAGPIAALLLLLTGRVAAAAPHLHGPGAAFLASTDHPGATGKLR
ncbi:maleylpyruvate isomerase family mycothiol-dependent enzyme [Actinoplanes solisilvae]|uniref:maleylpyruvate isomerase family mycothiol-dependent enzyme n=1 Tax=Actinoplanes solisilvae TaxID=2486853 RepID=UPI000FD6C306|nr:maleylpyruvate isomerase family mycothiol-dependent enzyme [Actinoplanes solisilvae]